MEKDKAQSEAENKNSQQQQEDLKKEDISEEFSDQEKSQKEKVELPDKTSGESEENVPVQPSAEEKSSDLKPVESNEEEDKTSKKDEISDKDSNEVKPEKEKSEGLDKAPDKSEEDVPAQPAAEVQKPGENADAKSKESKKEVKKETAEKTSTSEYEDIHEGDDSDDEHDDEHEEEDYSEYSKEQLVELIKQLAKSDNIIQAEKKAREIKPFYDELFEKQRAEAYEKFIAEGGEEGDFSYQPDELDNRFEANYKLLRDKRSAYLKENEQRKEENLKKKEEILERLREFVDSDESNFSFDKFKEIQAEWKSVGPIPQNQARTLWANYNALVDRFYDNRSIYFELKELDRKKNLEAKVALCEKAERLVDYENIKDAIRELNELHHDFKYIGPVPKDEQENVWQRFKKASDAVYARRKDYVESLKTDLAENEKIKKELGDKVQEFASFNSDRIKEWNEKTKKILEIQKQWEATGGLPRATAKEINKNFWNSFKKFFQNKSAFFKKLDVQRDENLKKKQELVKKAEELKDNTDWKGTAEKLKDLQRQWKDIGPVPEKVRDQVYKEFKAACDYFFDQKRANTSGVEKEYQENLTEKEKILDQIEKLAKEGEQDADKLKELQEQYDEIGFVPKRDVVRIKNRYTEVVDKFIKQLKNVDDEDRQKLKLESQIIKMKQGPNADHKLYKKEIALKKQIANVENEIATYKNNMEFFASSKKADKLKEEFKTKIKDANNQLKVLKDQLKIIRNA